MPTGIAPFRKQYILNPASTTYTYAGATPATQTFYVPIYQMRNVPDATMVKRCDALVMLISAASRLRMVNQGWFVEQCPYSPCDGIAYPGLRANRSFTETGALSQGLPNAPITAFSGSADPVAVWSTWWGSVAHEYFWIENGTYFPPGSRPAGHTSDVAITDWAEFATFQTQCNANGNAQTGGGLANGMRTAHRGQSVAFPTASIAWNATGAQVLTAMQSIAVVDSAAVQVWGGGSPGPLPATPVDIVFFGQYNQTPLPLMTVVSNNLTGGSSPAPVVTIQRIGAVGADPVARVSVTGSPTGGSFVLGFIQGLDDMTRFVGAGTSGTTPAQRITQWTTNICANNGWAL